MLNNIEIKELKQNYFFLSYVSTATTTELFASIAYNWKFYFWFIKKRILSLIALSENVVRTVNFIEGLFVSLFFLVIIPKVNVMWTRVNLELAEKWV